MGTFELTECPRRRIPVAVWDVIEAAELFEKGLAPVAGGVLDQAAVFVNAARFVWAEQARWKAEMWKRRG